MAVWHRAGAQQATGRSPAVPGGRTAPDSLETLAAAVGNASLARQATAVAPRVLRQPVPTLARHEAPPSTAKTDLGTSKLNFFKHEIPGIEFTLGAAPIKGKAKLVIEVSTKTAPASPSQSSAPNGGSAAPAGAPPAGGSAAPAGATPAGGATTTKLGGSGSSKGGGLEAEIKHQFGSGEFLSKALVDASIGTKIRTDGGEIAIGLTPNLPKLGTTWSWGAIEAKPTIGFSLVKVDRTAKDPRDLVKFATATINVLEASGTGNLTVGSEQFSVEVKLSAPIEFEPDWTRILAWLVQEAAKSQVVLEFPGLLVAEATGATTLGAAAGIAGGAGVAAGAAIVGGLALIGKAGSEGARQAVGNAWGSGYANRMVAILEGQKPAGAAGWRDKLAAAAKAYDVPSAERAGNPLQDARDAGAAAADEELAGKTESLEEVKRFLFQKYGVNNVQALKGKLLDEIHSGVKAGGGPAPSATATGGDW